VDRREGQKWTDPAKDLPEDAVDLDQLLTLVSVCWFAKGGAGAANFLHHAMHAEAARVRHMNGRRDSWPSATSR
jgi:hypothetical protein